MRRPGVQLQIAPSVPDEVTVGIGAIEAEQDERFFHHFLRLE